MTDSDGVSHTAHIRESYLKILTKRRCSFNAAAEREIVPDVIAKPSYIGLGHDTAIIDKTKTFEFPYRNIISVGAERFHGVDIFVSVKIHWQRNQRIPRHFFQNSTKCDADICKILYAHVTLSSGTTIFLDEGGLGILRSILVLLSELYLKCTRWCFQRSKSEQQLVNLGWNSDRVNVHVDALWKALNMKALPPVKVMEKMALCPAT